MKTAVVDVGGDSGAFTPRRFGSLSGGWNIF